MTTPFPIPQFVDIPPHDITVAVNELILEFNAVIVQSGGGAGATGYVTRHSLLQALNAQAKLGAVDTAINALAVTDPAWIEYKTALTCALNDALATKIASVTGYNTTQMAALWALAAGLTP